MTLIDFYVLQKNSVEDQHHFACRLIEKAVKQGMSVLLATKDAEESEAMDKALWSFRPESFVPHAILGDQKSADAPVLISHNDESGDHHDVLVNLRLEIPEHFSRFQRLAEIVVQEEAILNNSRQSYAFYKKRGYPINTHKLR